MRGGGQAAPPAHRLPQKCDVGGVLRQRPGGLGRAAAAAVGTLVDKDASAPVGQRLEVVAEHGVVDPGAPCSRTKGRALAAFDDEAYAVAGVPEAASADGHA